MKKAKNVTDARTMDCIKGLRIASVFPWCLSSVFVSAARPVNYYRGDNVPSLLQDVSGCAD